MPAGQVPGVEASKPRADGDLGSRDHGQQSHALLQCWSADEVPAAGELRGIVHGPRGVGGAHARREEATVLEFLLDVLESRRENHVHLPAVAHRNHRAEFVQQGRVKSSVMWYLVLLSPLANKMVAPLPAVHWKPCPLPTGTPANVRP